MELICNHCGCTFKADRPSRKSCSVSCGARRYNYSKEAVIADLRGGIGYEDISLSHAIPISSIAKLAREYNIHRSNNRFSIRLTEEQTTLVFGTLLGDAHAHKLPSGKFRLKVSHGPKQFNYVDWKYNILRNITSTPPTTVLTPDAYGDSIRKFTTNCNIDITNIAAQLYDSNGTKGITRQYLDQLNSMSLAFWFMDDGNLVDYQSALATHCFTIQESQLIARWFGDRYDCPEPILVLDKRCDKWFLRFGVDLARRIKNDIADLFPHFMRYKLCH